MPFATVANVSTSTLSSSNLTGRISAEKNRTTTTSSASPFQRASAMGVIKNSANENVDSSFSKLPNLRIQEVLGASQPSKLYLEPVGAGKQFSNSSACVPMTVAVAEFKGPEVHGVVRFAQASDAQQECAIEVEIDGLAPGAHGWSVHEFGDLTQGPWSTGAAYDFPLAYPSSVAPVQDEENSSVVEVGNLGSLWVDREGHVQSSSSNGRITVADIIGRSVVLYGHGDASLTTRVAAAVIARSARASRLTPQLCNCEGSLIWQGKATPTLSLPMERMD